MCFQFFLALFEKRLIPCICRTSCASHVTGYFNIAGRFAIMSQSIFDMSDGSDCFFAKTTSVSCQYVLVRRKASLCISISMTKCQAGFHHFTQISTFQIAQFIFTTKNMAPLLVDIWIGFSRFTLPFWWSIVLGQLKSWIYQKLLKIKWTSENHEQNNCINVCLPRPLNYMSEKYRKYRTIAKITGIYRTIRKIQELQEIQDTLYALLREHWGRGMIPFDSPQITSYTHPINKHTLTHNSLLFRPFHPFNQDTIGSRSYQFI